MKYKNIHTQMLALLIIILFGCIDKIEFSPPSTFEDGVVIQGKLTKGAPSVVEVEIKEVFSLSGSPRFINAQYVELWDNQGNNWELNSNVQGKYQLNIEDTSEHSIEYGNAYQIKLALNNGEIYESLFDTLYPSISPNELKVVFESQVKTNNLGFTDTVEVLKFMVDTEFPVFNGQNTNMLWEFESVYKLTDSPRIYRTCPRDCWPTTPRKLPKTCFVNFNPNSNYQTLNTSSLSENKVSDFLLLEAASNSFVFSEGFYLTVFQESISESTHNYWSIANEITNREGTIFEPPVGKIPTNFFNLTNKQTEAFGYFFTTEAKINRIFVSPELANHPQRICPGLPNPDGSGPGNCCNCLCEPNSTLEQPEWWVE